VFNEGQINVLLWYYLVGAYIGLPLGVEVNPGSKWLRQCTWYGDDGPHLAGILYWQEALPVNRRGW